MVLIQKVKRNKERFPEDFCFQMSELEFKNWKSQIVMSNSDKMGLRIAPYVFTEQRFKQNTSIRRCVFRF